MKWSRIASLLALVSASAASPVPQNSQTEAAPTETSLPEETQSQDAPPTQTSFPTFTYDPLPAAASPFPAGPTTNEFQYEHYDENSQEDKDNRVIIHNAFASDWAETMQKGIEAVADTNDDTFDRWFPPEVVKADGSRIDARAYVSGVWRQMFQPDQTTPTPKAVISTFINDKDDYGDGGKGLCKPKTFAYFTQATGRFHVCKRGLALPPKASDIKCEDLGKKVSTKMRALTGTLVHEFHHSDFGDNAPNSVGHITDVLPAVGPSNCFRLRKAPTESNNQKTFRNADSYRWLAVNAYYNSKCGFKFEDPEIETEEADDFEESMAELMASPEYDPELTSGALAGV